MRGGVVHSRGGEGATIFSVCEWLVCWQVGSWLVEFGERGVNHLLYSTHSRFSATQLHSGLIFSWSVPPLGLGFVIKARPSSSFWMESRNLYSCNLFIVII